MRRRGFFPVNTPIVSPATFNKPSVHFRYTIQHIHFNTSFKPCYTVQFYSITAIFCNVWPILKFTINPLSIQQKGITYLKTMLPIFYYRLAYLQYNSWYEQRKNLCRLRLQSPEAENHNVIAKRSFVGIEICYI